MSDIINPYIAGNPVTGSEMFFGRDDVFEFIRRTLIGRHQDNVIVLYGQRRTGKTSVLYQMRFHLEERYLCIFVDLHGFALESLDGFLWELANHIIRVLRRDYQINLPRPDRGEFMVEPRHFFENEFLNQIWSSIEDRHLLLMLDEAVRIQEQVQAGKLDHEIFAYMRHLMQHHERLNFLFSLGSGLEEMEEEYAFLFNVGLYKKISFLDRDATYKLITQPVKDYYQVELSAQQRIYRITSGHPYYTQLLCHGLFNYWQKNRIPRIVVRDVDKVLSEAVERGSAVLKHVWEESAAAEKAIIASMAAIGDRNRPVRIDAINSIWSRLSAIMPAGERAKAIRSLIARDVIIGDGKYAFTVDLLRLWVQKHRRPEWVKEEIADDVQAWSLSSTTVSGNALQNQTRSADEPTTPPSVSLAIQGQELSTIAAPVVTPSRVSPQSPKLSQHSKKRLMLWIGLGLAAILLLGIGFGVIFTLARSKNVPQLNESYSGYVTATNGSQSRMNLYIDSEDQQGNLSAKVLYDLGGLWRCTGMVGGDNGISLQCTNVNAKTLLVLAGIVQQGGSIIGVDSLGEKWTAGRGVLNIIPTVEITATVPPVPTPTVGITATAQAQPTLPQLNSSYAGTVTASNGSQGAMNLYIDSEDQQGNLNGRVFYNVSGGQWRCTGKVGSDNVLSLSCNNANNGNQTLLLVGTVQQNGSIIGSDSFGGSWTVS